MKIFMNQMEGSATSHEIRVEFRSGARIELLISGVDTATQVYKALYQAYENGQEDEADFQVGRNIRNTIAKTKKALGKS